MSNPSPRVSRGVSIVEYALGLACLCLVSALAVPSVGVNAANQFLVAAFALSDDAIQVAAPQGALVTIDFGGGTIEGGQVSPADDEKFGPGSERGPGPDGPP